jgi:hypothetical protein
MQIMSFKIAGEAQRDVLKGWPFLALRLRKWSPT